MVRDSEIHASLLLALDSMAPPSIAGAPGAEQPAWYEPLRRIEAALATNDTHGMLRAWNAAGLAATEDDGWMGYVALGDIALRIAFATGLHIVFASEARHAYLVALGRAHRARELAGVLRVAQGFAALGDEDLVEQCVYAVDRLRAATEGPVPPR